MLSLSTLNEYFYNGRYGESISFSDLHAKWNPISRGEGVPRYTYSESSNDYIPTSGYISLSDFDEIKVQTGSVSITTSDVRLSSSGFIIITSNVDMSPESINSYHPDLTSKSVTSGASIFDNWTEIYIGNREVAVISLVYVYSHKSNGSGYHKFDHAEIDIAASGYKKPYIWLIYSENTGSRVLGSVDDIKGLSMAIYKRYSTEFSLIIVENLHFVD